MPIALRFSFDNISINDYVTPNVERVDVYISFVKEKKTVDDFSFSGRIEQKTKSTSVLKKKSSSSFT